jgi:hypothetical protein
MTESQQRTRDVALTAIFLYAGAAEALPTTRGEWANGGYIGMGIDMVEYAERVVDRLFALDPQVPDGFPGVFEYEVTEPLGSWLANNRANVAWPNFDDPQFIAETDRRIKEFFAQ